MIIWGYVKSLKEYIKEYEEKNAIGHFNISNIEGFGQW